MKHFLLFLFLTLPILTLRAQQPGWKQLNKQSIEQIWTSVHFSDPLHGAVVGTDGKIVTTDDGGMVWTERQSGTTEKLNRVRFLNNARAYIAGDNGVLLRSDDGGTKWYALNAETSQALSDVFFIDENIGFIGGQASFLKKSTDGGITWTIRDPKFGPNNINAIDFVNPNVGYLVGNQAEMARTSNSGETWRSLDAPFQAALYSVSFATPYTGTAVGEAGTIFHTNDAGQHWESQKAEVPISSLPLGGVQHIDSNTAIIVGWESIILRTINGGMNWVPQITESYDGLKGLHFVTDSIGYAVGTNGVMIATKNQGVSILSSIGVSSFPEQMNISSAYPNPQSSALMDFITLPFHLGKGAEIHLTVLDLLGNVIHETSSEFFTQGDHRFLVNTKALSKGIYFVKVFNSDVSTMQKFIVQ